MMHGGRGLASAARRITSAPSILNTCSDCLAHSGLKAKDIFTFSSRNNERQQGSLRPVAFFLLCPMRGRSPKAGAPCLRANAGVRLAFTLSLNPSLQLPGHSMGSRQSTRSIRYSWAGRLAPPASTCCLPSGGLNTAPPQGHYRSLYQFYEKENGFGRGGLVPCRILGIRRHGNVL